jgi:hypothetical protein
MRFKIHHTTHRQDEEPPCVGAVLDTSTADEFSDGEWFIEISSLEELMGIIKTTGHPLVLQNSEHMPMDIEIYNDWRE